MDPPKNKIKITSRGTPSARGRRGVPRREIPTTPRQSQEPGGVGIRRGRRGVTRREIPTTPRQSQEPDGVGTRRVTDENAIGRPITPRRQRDVSKLSIDVSKRKTAKQGQYFSNYQTPIEQPPLFQTEEKTTSDKAELISPSATFTGFRELPVWRAFLILLLWLPRFFIPWIASWHEFNVFVLSNPWHWKDRDGEMHQNKTYVIVGKSIIAILCSVLVDLTQKKCKLEYYVYFCLLVLFTTSPLAGGLVDVLLRAQFQNAQIYFDWWFTSVVMMQWAMSVAFMMFPVQFACIYSQNSKMSRNAHYNWTSLFTLLEFINAYIAFLVIPGPCPTKNWTQIAVWAGIALLMITVTMLTLIFLFAARPLRNDMLMCFKRQKAVKEPDPDPFIDAPSAVKVKKLMWFSVIAVPVIITYFTFAVLESFIPYEEWDNHRFESALGFFLFWKIIGVVFTVLVMFIVRKADRMRKMLGFKGEMIYLGLPYVLCILALVTLAGRFATLSRLNEGDIIVGPVPDNDKAVLVFVNSVFRNRTICISSEKFRPVKVRPRRYVTRELYDVDEGNITVTVQVDPCSKPYYTFELVVSIKKGEWKVYDVALLYQNLTEKYVWDYYRDVYTSELLGVGNLRPKIGAPQLVIYQKGPMYPRSDFFYELNHTSIPSVRIPLSNRTKWTPDWTNDRYMILWEVPATGTWTVRLWAKWFYKSPAIHAWISNCSQCVSPLQFEVENNSLYLLVEHSYEEDISYIGSYTDNQGPVDTRFPMFPCGYTSYKIGEVAGPNSDRLPSNKELQRDWAVKVSMALAGMAAGVVFQGFVYLFWVDPPIPRYRTITLAVCWALMGVAAGIPRIKSIDVGLKVSILLLTLQIIVAGMHLAGAYFMYTPTFNFRIRAD